jgi:hypothetical protein
MSEGIKLSEIEDRCSEKQIATIKDHLSKGYFIDCLIAESPRIIMVHPSKKEVSIVDVRGGFQLMDPERI